MFRRGKVLKVKVELSPDVVGFGRATILDTEGSFLFLQLKTSKGEKRSLPKGTRVWFVSDSIENPFNGLWSTTIISSRLIGGKTALKCSRPKFEAVVQKRKHRRVGLNCPVRVHGEAYDRMPANTRNLSRSGAGIEIHEDCSEQFPGGHYVDVTIESPVGSIMTRARVIQSRYNWLANKTDIGLEFIDTADDAMALLDRLLLSLGGQARLAPDGKESSSHQQRQLSSWLKSSKENVAFVKTAEKEATSIMSSDDLDELQDDDDIEGSDED